MVNLGRDNESVNRKSRELRGDISDLKSAEERTTGDVQNIKDLGIYVVLDYKSICCLLCHLHTHNYACLICS